MKITVLSDNISRDNLLNEWGLSFYIEYNDRKYLLDTGGSANFLANAAELGIDISEIDAAVLSHAHYDHSLGMEAFFEANSKAPFYLSPSAKENCYAGWRFLSRYIGLPKGILTRYHDRIIMPEGTCMIDDGVYIIPHSTPGLKQLGRKSRMYVRNGLVFSVDDFAHEQTLAFRTESGIVVFNSCSHSGPDVVIDEVERTFPGERIAAYFGGLHLFRMNERYVNTIAEKLIHTRVGKIYTGHCTGDRPFALLQGVLGDSVEQFYCGKSVTIA